MFIEFSFGNFRSFRDTQKFTLEAAPLRSNDSGLEEGNVIEVSSQRLLKSKAIYGSNASGKSNLAKAIGAFSSMVEKSVAFEGLPRRIWNDRFKLITNWDDQPVFFQYIFLHEGNLFRYGFQILEGKVSYEWLYGGDGAQETEYFMRHHNDLKIRENHLFDSGPFMQKALKANHEIFRSDSLILTAAALNGNEFLSGIREAIKNIIIVSGSHDEHAAKHAMNTLLHGSEEQKAAIKKLLAAADTGIEDIELHEEEGDYSQNTSRDGSEDKFIRLFSLHSRYDEHGEFKDKIQVPFDDWESVGTVKLLVMGSLIIRALQEGRTIVIDELDARLHPNLTLKIVELFHTADTSPNNAQLIFVTHDAGLLRRANLRRDQICFVDKDRYGLSTLTNLIEFKGVRKDASYDKEYLNGSYSAIPFLSDIDSIFYRKKNHDV